MIKINVIMSITLKNEIHINLTLQRTTKNSLSRAGFERASSGFKLWFRCSLQCQINMNLVFHISEDGSKIPLPCIMYCTRIVE